MFDVLHRNGKLNACIQENFICLIRKKEDAIHVRDLRPISLTTFTYKVVAKVLADKLKGVMNLIISPYQSAFIEDRQILDPILIANKAVEDYCANKKKGWILKLDLEKAFDRVDGGFLEKVLQPKMDFLDYGLYQKYQVLHIYQCMGNDEFSRMAGKLGCKMEKLRFLYMGLPLGRYPRKFDWQTLNNSGNNLRSPWISISGEWEKVVELATFKTGNGRRVAFWTDSWVADLPLKP
ncbi:uncharacterized protein E5676_scaffold680G00040 [Cucumis melo var. makuwa]|uniref:Reverse transcriptase domain-containing protein n=1 Tax=Cucumis melo var. makuwa TaxID=1194695 RepID=A0A5D3BT88_CUCMM|nr:uncharacterized protein E5676_scaffold680G00040 [Cucumis melo var. makuwa]